MVEQLALGFGDLLRQLRAEAGLTQEELAEAAGLSPRSVSDLERGIHPTARKDTAELLAGALGLAGPARPVFVAAARGRAPAEQALAALRGEAVAPGGAAAGQGPAWPGGPSSARPSSWPPRERSRSTAGDDPACKPHPYRPGSGFLDLGPGARAHRPQRGHHAGHCDPDLSQRATPGLATNRRAGARQLPVLEDDRSTHGLPRTGGHTGRPVDGQAMVAMPAIF
jgi:transcriptional regulator with XRE-family HTH domain